MSEGGLKAPERHPIDWKNPDFYDRDNLDAEMRRVFDVCHSCRRCFNLCDSFPRLFDLIDDSETGELDSVESSGFQHVVDACTLCDMCFMSKCPYVPPHEFNIDFPHLMLRYRAVEFKEDGPGFAERQLTRTDRNGKAAAPVAGLVNWAGKRGNPVTRPALQAVAGVHKDAELPKYHRRTLTRRAAAESPPVNKEAPAHGRKSALFATCYGNYNKPGIGEATRAVLAQNGVETEIVYPECCGMPQLEQGNLPEVARKAEAVAAEMRPWIDDGYDIVALVPSCALMLKFEWPLIVPDNDDIQRLAENTRDVSEYIVELDDQHGLAEGMESLPGAVTLHLACHSRAQNMGAKAAEMLRLIPDATLDVIERCSGHGGSWGVMKENFPVAIKVGKPVARKAAGNENPFVVSECPLAADHILQGIEETEPDATPARSYHPIELMARAYGLGPE